MKTRLLLIALLIFAVARLSASTIIDSLKSLLTHQGGIELVQTINELSWHYKNIDVDSALLYARQGLRFGAAFNSQQAIALSLNSMGNAFEAKGLVDSALYYHNQCLIIKRSYSDTLGIANSLNNIGILYDEMGDYSRSLAHYFEALGYFEELGDLGSQAMIFGNIGIVYKKQKVYEDVLQYYKKALRIYKTLNHDFGTVVTTGNIGSVYINLGKYDSSILFSQQARAGYLDLDYVRYVPYINGNIAIALDSMGNYNEALTLYQKTIDGHIEHENSYELANTYLGLGLMMMKIGNYASALANANKGIPLARSSSAVEFLIELKKLQARALGGLQQYEQAFSAFSEFYVGKDSLYQKERVRQIFELEAKYETAKKEQQIELQQAEIAEQEAQNRQKVTVIITLILAVISLSVIILLVRSRARKKQALIRQEAELNLREAQIESTIQSQEQERSRYAKDLHDGFGQMISILNLNLKSLAEDKPDRHKVFDNSSKILDEMYTELKNICFNLMPQTLILSGLPAAISEFADRINRTDQLHVDVDIFGMEQRLGDLQEVSMYRIIQEWVNNILKYSDAKRIMIQLTRDEGELTLLIEDDGLGFDTKALENSSGNGWRNIHTRCKLVQGALVLDTQVGRKGNTLIIEAKSTVTKHSTAFNKVTAD